MVLISLIIYFIGCYLSFRFAFKLILEDINEGDYLEGKEVLFLLLMILSSWLFLFPAIIGILADFMDKPIYKIKDNLKCKNKKQNTPK